VHCSTVTSTTEQSAVAVTAHSATPPVHDQHICFTLLAVAALLLPPAAPHTTQLLNALRAALGSTRMLLLIDWQHKTQVLPLRHSTQHSWVHKDSQNIG
jgi:hypothetical protein